MKKYIFLLLLALLFIPSVVNADEYFKDGGYIGQTYIKKIRSDGSGQYKRMKSILRASDNKLSYCIAPWSNIDESSPYKEVSSINGINPNTLERIKLISYYGYGYKNHTDDIWYSVTQLLIWREIDPTGKFYFTSTLNGDYTNIYDGYFNEILSLVNNHKLKLDTNEVTLIARQPYTINVLEGNLDDFDVIDPGRIVQSVNGNKINIRTELKGDYTITIRRKQIYNNFVLLYQSDTSQDMMTYGNVYEEYKVNIKSLYGEATVYKRDKETGTVPQGDAKLEGTWFIMQGPEVGGIIEMSESLFIKWETLPYGHYTICEYEPNVGYELNNTCFTFDISTSTRTYEFVMENTVIKNMVHIHKKYNNPWNEYLDEEGITFEVYLRDKLYTTCTTNKEGLINIELPYGTYIFHQVNTKDGYAKVDDFEVQIKDSTEVIEYELVNSLKEGHLLLTKYYGNEDNKKIEPDTEFELYIGDKLYSIVKTNKEGILDIDIPYGTYRLHQTSSKYGYQRVDDITFTIDDNNTNIELELLDKEILGTLEVNKLYEVDNTFIEEENAIFEIYKDNELINTMRTDNKGYFSIQLPYGKYRLHEVITNSNYIEQEDLFFEIGDNNTLITYNLKDYLKKYTLTINKKDLLTDLLINTDEILFLVTGNNNEYELKTINGIASITLPIGEYSIKEVNANIGYVLNEDIININLDKNTEIDFYNSKIEVPDTNTSYSSLLFIFIFIFITLKRIKKYS